MRINDNHESAKSLLVEHVAARFPDECEGMEIAGVDLEELNGTVRTRPTPSLRGE